jgi:hypothetical protein
MQQILHRPQKAGQQTAALLLVRCLSSNRLALMRASGSFALSPYSAAAPMPDAKRAFQSGISGDDRSASPSPKSRCPLGESAPAPQ